MTTIVPVRMKEYTLEQVDNLQKRVHAPSRSDAIRRAVEISDTLINAVEHGDRVIIESKNVDILPVINDEDSYYA